MQQRALVWQHGQLNADLSFQALENAVHDQQALTWLDVKIEDDALQCASMLTNLFNLSPLTLQIMEEEKERAKLVKGHDYFYLVVHGLDFDTTTSEASTPKVDIIFGRNFLVTAHRSKLPWLDKLFESAQDRKSVV